MNYKSDYIVWANTALDIQDSTKKQYVTSIENLNKIVGYNIFEKDNIDEIDVLYQDLLKEQKNLSGKYYETIRPSSSLKGWYSASVKTYLDFLKERLTGPIIKNNIINQSFKTNVFHTATKEAGLIFSLQIIQRFIASLSTKPFVICSGLSGSGKTKLAQAFAMWLCESKEQYLIVPVGADWTNREPLLGYTNALNKEEYVVSENGVLNLIIRANDNPAKPYFLILDEMNLSHVERYFADFLSTMESGDKIPLHRIADEKNNTPQQLKLPKNLFIIGTVNIDETTYMFSPKVLDRANTIEFRVTEDDLKQYIGSNTKLDMNLLAPDDVGVGAAMAQSFVDMATKETAGNIKDSEEILLNFFNELKKNGAEFGYRTTSEIGRLMQMLDELGETSKENQMDIAVMQKLLPKLHGSRTKLSKVLVTLGRFCVNESEVKDVKAEIFETAEMPDFKGSKKIKYPLSLEKIYRMYKNALENGFTSYAEA